MSEEEEQPETRGLIEEIVNDENPQEEVKDEVGGVEDTPTERGGAPFVPLETAQE